MTDDQASYGDQAGYGDQASYGDQRKNLVILRAPAGRAHLSPARSAGAGALVFPWGRGHPRNRFRGGAEAVPRRPRGTLEVGSAEADLGFRVLMVRPNGFRIAI